MPKASSKSSATVGADSSADGRMRIAKAMARAGLCSRRDAERWIAEGRVSVNGAVLASPAITVGPADKIEVDGKALRKPEPTRLWRYHKPRGRVTTHRDPEGRPTVFEAMPEDMPRVISIGRLDFNTEGLLLLTNNGALARHLELPATGWLRRYRVRAHGNVAPKALASLRDGIEVDGVHYGPIEASLDRQQGANVWLTIGLREGKNREVRKILATLRLEVTRLIRLSFGPFALGDLEPGEIDEVAPRVISEQVGGSVAAEMGLRRVPANAGRKPTKDGPATAQRSDGQVPQGVGRTPAVDGLAHGRRAHHPAARKTAPTPGRKPK